MNTETIEALATQIPVAVLFAIFAFALFVIVLRFIREERAAGREERKEFLKALSDITSEVKSLKDNLGEEKKKRYR